MFELPAGRPVNQTISLEEGVLQPFAHGAISTYLGRRKTPVGHRLVRGGRVVGYLADAEEKNTLLGGVEAKQRLEQLEAGRSPAPRLVLHIAELEALQNSS